MVLSLFKKKENKEKQSGPSYFKLRIKEVIRETSDAITIVFDSSEEDIKYKPGQFLTIILDVAGEKTRRSYSLCSSPHTDKDLAVTVKKIDGGKVSNYINDELKEGDIIEVMEPMGKFTTELDSHNRRSFIIFAGGSGITPLMSLVKSALDQEPDSNVILIYQNRDEKSIIFNEKIKSLISEYGDRLKVEHVLSQPSQAWKGHIGRLSDVHIQNIFDKHAVEKSNAHVFLCGPQGMMETAESKLEELGIESERRYKESFTSSSTETKSDVNTESPSKNSASSVTISLNDEEFTIPVKSNEAILETALDAGLDMPFSCQSGLCTACRGKLIAGEVHMEDPDGLSDSEIDDGYILTCVSHPVSSDIKIEIG